MKWLERILRSAERAPEPARGDPGRIAEVEVVLSRVASALAADGGHVRVVAVEESGDVVLAFGGACVACQAQSQTLRQGIEPLLQRELPWVRGVSVIA